MSVSKMKKFLNVSGLYLDCYLTFDNVYFAYLWFRAFQNIDISSTNPSVSNLI